MYFFNDFKIHLVLKILHKTLPHVNVIAHQILRKVLHFTYPAATKPQVKMSTAIYTCMYM